MKYNRPMPSKLTRQPEKGGGREAKPGLYQSTDPFWGQGRERQGALLSPALFVTVSMGLAAPSGFANH